MNDIISSVSGILKSSQKILIFSGAGLSTESGIPDFRSPGGIWDKYDPSDFYYDKFISDEKAREKYWMMSREFYAVMKDAQPNRAHKAIREIEDTGKLLAVVTQNIDNLHQKAGTSLEKIIEIHGSAFTVSCLSCGRKYDREDIERRMDSGIIVPYCDVCSGILKPDTISFGQSMPQDKMAQAFSYADECDLCMVLGSSLVVYPAASVPVQASRSGAKLIIINRDNTPLDIHADVVIHDSVSEVMTRILSP